MLKEKAEKATATQRHVRRSFLLNQQTNIVDNYSHAAIRRMRVCGVESHVSGIAPVPNRAKKRPMVLQLLVTSRHHGRSGPFLAIGTPYGFIRTLSAHEKSIPTFVEELPDTILQPVIHSNMYHVHSILLLHVSAHDRDPRGEK